MHILGTVIKKKKVIILGIIYILLLILVILAGKAKKMKLQEQVSQSDSRPITTEQVSVSEDSTEKTKASSGSYSSFDTASVLQTLASATEAKNNGLLTLVNMSHTLPADWTVDLVELRNDQSIDRRAYDGLQKMMDDARAEGLDPLICSSYRTNETQERLYTNKKNSYLEQGYSEDDATALAATWVAYPGTSEHQLGLTVDICYIGNQELDSSQEDTATQQWLMANCYKYGFILRYPADKSDITEISYEPWHYRYVGVEAATEMYQKHLCLEEYLEQHTN